ncbi:MAG: ABC transporter ATP-binding protein [Syntrophothermus sp.]
MIVAENLRKVYKGRDKEIAAVDGISFDVREGEVFGFLGPNGAGKTTTIRMLIGLTRPTSGVAKVDGLDSFRDGRRVHERINVVFGEQNLYERLSGEENLRFFARLYGVEQRRVDMLLEKLQLTDRKKDAVSKYSKGMRQRVLIGRALLNNPRVLFLDEPTNGLDPSSAHVIRSLIRELQGQGTTIFLTTHYMEEADQLCDRVAFIHAGRLAAVDTPQRLKMAHGRKVVRLELANSGKQGEPGIWEPEGRPSGEVQTEELPMDAPATADRVRELLASGRVLTIHSQEATLADVFMKLTGRELQ